MRNSELDSVAVNVGAIPSGFGSGSVGGKGVPPAAVASMTIPATTGGGASTPQGTDKGPWMDLDAFYAEGEEEDEEKSRPPV